MSKNPRVFISKFAFGLEKLPDLSRNGSLVRPFITALDGLVGMEAAYRLDHPTT